MNNKSLAKELRAAMKLSPLGASRKQVIKEVAPISVVGPATTTTSIQSKINNIVYNVKLQRKISAIKRRT